MKINLSKKTIGIGLAIIFGLGLLFLMQRGRGEGGATVNGERIDMAPILKRVEALGKADPGRFAGEAGADDAKYLTQMFLNEAIAAKAAQQAALKAGVSVSDAEVDAEINNAAKLFKSKDEFIKKQLEQGFSDYMLRDTLTSQIAILKMRVKLAKEARVTPGEISGYIAENKKDFENPVPQVKLSVITIKDEGAASEVLAALKKGADFKTLAKAKSVEKEIDIGWHPTDYLEPVAAGAVRGLPVGGFTTESFPNPDNTLSIYKVEDKQTRTSTESEKQTAVERRILRFRQAYSFKQWYKDTTKNADVERF